MRPLLVACALVALLSTAVAGKQAAGACGCEAKYSPVCGSDGITYGTACMAKCMGREYTPGPCDASSTKQTGPWNPTCLCDFGDDPVCTPNGVEYETPCTAECVGVKEYTKGSCTKPNPGCACIAIYKPVCAGGIYTYSSACQAGCSGATGVTDGACGDGGNGGDGLKVIPEPTPLPLPLPPKPEVCTCASDVIDFLCTANSMQYSSPCEAKCMGVTDYTMGKCAFPNPRCVCPANYAPVCANGVKTYSNLCMAKCAGATAILDGVCGTIEPVPEEPNVPSGPVNPVCPCTREYAPVCTANGVQYSNPCLARCVGVSQFTEGPCAKARPACLCVDLYKPVCANSVFTYSNECAAKCAGASVLAGGECKGAPKPSPEVHPDVTYGPENPLCDCPEGDEEPVCSWNQVQYKSACAAECVGVTKHTPGWCSRPNMCMCMPPNPEQPVCANGVFEFNGRCAAGCAGVTEITEGKCKVVQTGPVNPLCDCPEGDEPVCSANGVQYASACAAECVGVTSYKTGVCPHGGAICMCAPPLVPDPTCANAIFTFYSKCAAGCAGATELTPGRCTAEQTGPINPACTCPAGPSEVDPVCTPNGVQYYSPCMAGCAGVTEYQDGVCPHGTSMCSCAPPRIPAPVCANGVMVYMSRCAASCAGATEITDGVCKPLPPKPEPVEQNGPINPACTCPADDNEPVCSANGVQYSSECMASCVGVTDYYKGVCEGPRFACRCSLPDPPAPVCANGIFTFNSRCNADCAGVTVMSEGDCGSIAASPEPEPEPPVTHGPVNPACACLSEIVTPVCTRNSVQYSSPCAAKCVGVTEFTMGKCSRPNLCMCMPPNPPQPVCANGVFEFNGKCAAGCAGVTVMTEGKCGSTTPAPKPSPAPAPAVTWGPVNPACNCPMDPLALVAPVCSWNGVQYKSACEAECVGVTRYKTGMCSRPLMCACRPPSPAQPVCANGVFEFNGKCAAGCAGVDDENIVEGKCTPQQTGPINPACSCLAGDINPVCTPNGVQYDSPCMAECVGVTKYDKGVCPHGSSMCMCALPLTPQPVCANGIMDYVSKCAAGCAGVTVMASGTCAEQPAAPSSCADCPMAYKPVCASDGKTWPNRCAAECSGLSVKREGKCAFCRGETCKWASKGEVCTLGAKRQCWYKKYACGIAGSPVIPNGAVFGTCLPKPLPKGHHRHLLEEEEEEEEE